MGSMKNVSFLLLFLISTLFHPTSVFSQESDPLDTFDFSFQPPTVDESGDDSGKSAEELIREADMLLSDERPLEARTKLLRAIERDPSDPTPYTMLSGYYLVHVGHFRLALKYVKRAEELFEAKHGPPPYTNYVHQIQHAHLLHLLSQARLNLDNYGGALQTLDRYESYGYYQDWYPGSRAWVLMKLGRLDDAVEVARVGLLAGAEPGRTLNILGILLSMQGERERSLEVFRRATAYEFSLGSMGQPATPLNNAGEVHREIFEEGEAEQSWLKATRLPDGCEHVLPSLNLATLQLEQLDTNAAKRAIDNFESCFAQYPLRNGEEHRALVHLARGRIALQNGQVPEAIEHLDEALNRQQWFGKIGTNVEDLQVAAMVSFAKALRARIARSRFRPFTDFTQKLEDTKQWALDSFQIWWLERKALQILTEKLNAGEDLYVRNTDSMIFYPSLGIALARLPYSILAERLSIESKEDARGPAQNYYDSYLAENYLRNKDSDGGLQRIREVRSRLRVPFDDALHVHLLLTEAQQLSPSSVRYATLLTQAFRLSRGEILNYGLSLPVNFTSSGGAQASALEESGFLVLKGKQREFLISHALDETSHRLQFISQSGLYPTVSVSGSNLDEVIEKLQSSVFVVSDKT